ncbi:MAG: polysaccharide deacetylase family protein [Clostridia bacterium]|jgi:peptidoglycan-N-acetylmuramic acid deacetylase|nr:polysaccharide deacetylase family protein [Clostridia bacterium]MBQ4366311.1 polysaccharide deacetylase family protein [Clostridia bacterium]
MKQRLTAGVLCLCLLLSLSGCVDDRQGVPNPGGQSTSSEPAGSTEPGSVQAEQSTAIAAPPSVPLGVITHGAPDESTKSGFAPLPATHYDAPDPENSRGLSTAKKEHSHGPASAGKAHHTVVSFQDTFDRYGALTLDRTSGRKVLYLTFDCGWEYENLTAKILDILREKQVPAAFFCTGDHIRRQPDLIARMLREGHIVGNHSDTHPSFPTLSRAQMAGEIEGVENELRTGFGYCAKYFRFPAGEYSDNALDLVQSLGYCSVFWSVAWQDWDVTKTQGAAKAKQTILDRLHPGAVILLHAVSKDNAAALGDVIDEARAQGYVFSPLSAYSPPVFANDS